MEDWLLGFGFAFLISAITTPAGVSGAVFLLPVQVSVLGVPSPSVTPTNLLYNVLAIPLAAMGMLNPLLAAAAMALSDVTVIGNALLLRRARIDGNPDQNGT